MRKIFFSYFLISVFQPFVFAQKSFEIIPSVGQTFSPSMSFRNCTGEFNSATNFSLSGIYHPDPSWGLELNFTTVSPTTYLNFPADNSVSVYTHSTINIQRLLAGINYSPPIKKLHPYIGFLLGFSQATTSDIWNPGSYTSFSWSIQTGAAYYFSPLIGIRLNGAFIATPNIPNNSAYFNVDGSGDGFPSFALGDPSQANLIQWNINLGIIVRFVKNGKSTNIK
jgi:hypothetical protein